MIRVAAVGDLHVDAEGAEVLGPRLARLADDADVLLLAGDLTRCGGRREADALAAELARVPVPVVAVLGNHDHHAGEPREVGARLAAVGVRVLEGEQLLLDVRGSRVGIVGTIGFGGGFEGACGSDFGEPEMKAFIGHTQRLAARLEQRLAATEADVRIVLLHYAPVPETLFGERLEIYPFLGSYLFAEAVDRIGADLVVHGHAHAGSERGMTRGGVRVRNVALPLINRPYRVFSFTGRELHVDGALEIAP